MTRREFSIDFFNFVFMAFFFAALFVAPFVCAWHYMDRAISAGNTAPRAETTYPLAVLGEPVASVPKAINREAGADPQADRATPCRAIPSPVSEGSERSDLRVILPTSGAVQVDSSHGVRRAPEESLVAGVAQGLARSSSGIRGEASMVSAQGVTGSSASSPAPSMVRRSSDGGGQGQNIPGERARELRAISSGSLRVLAVSIAGERGLDIPIFLALIGDESSWNPRAVGKHGERGLLQLKAGTAAWCGIRDRFNAADNLTCGARYLRAQFDEFGSWEMAVVAFKAGPGSIPDDIPAHSWAYAQRTLRKAETLR